MDINRINIIHNLYRIYLNRNADNSGINTYYKLTNTKEGIKKLINIILNGEEYIIKQKMKSGNIGNRMSYIDNKNDTKILKIIMDPLIKIVDMMLLLEYNYSSKEIISRREMVIKNIIDIKNKNRNFTLFPHIEFDFNTEKFIDSIKNIKKFKYFILYLTLWCLYKVAVNKEVKTDLSYLFIDNLYNIINFKDLFLFTSDYFINYFSIKIANRLLYKDEKDIFINYILNDNSEDGITFLENVNSKLRENENEIIINNIQNLTKTLNRKPKVLIMIPNLETQNLYFIDKMLHHVTKVKEKNQNLDIDVMFDNERVLKEANDYTPWSRVKRIRNIMINKYPIFDYDYLFWIDSDIVDYPHDFISRAIGLNQDGITAPLVLVQYSSLFYDIAGFQIKNSTCITKDDILNDKFNKITINYQPPYLKDMSRLSEVDCVGSIYVMPTKIFSLTYEDAKEDLLKIFEIADVKNHKIKENKVQFEDHPFYTDHYTVCRACISNGYKVLMDTGSVAYHADLPMYGESWH